MYLSLGFVLFAAVCPASSFSWSRGCTEPLVGEEKPQLSSGVFWLKLRFCLFFTLSKVSESCWRSHCWEEEKCKCYFKVLVSLGISTACSQDGSPAVRMDHLHEYCCDSWFLEYQNCCCVSYRKPGLDIGFAFASCFFPVWRKGNEISCPKLCWITNSLLSKRQNELTTSQEYPAPVLSCRHLWGAFSFLK